jgi:hypothetical protein
MRLYFDAASESLFWDEFNNDPFSTDVTNDPRFRKAAKEQGLKEPEVISDVIEMTAHTPKGEGIAGAIVASYKKWERKPADLYPTPVDGTESLIPALKAMKRPDGQPIKRIWEPACGDGRLARVLEWHGFEVISTDLREYPGYGYGGLDFLREHPKAKWGWHIGDIDAIVTNPPFSLAEEFIRRALSITPNVAMLLKQTYWNVGGRSAGLWIDHMPDLELKLTWRLAFLAKERGNSPLMDCMWNVWFGENANLPLAQRSCTAEPLIRRRYPGYAGTGLKAAMQVLEGELADLAKVLPCLLDNQKDD